MKFSIYKKGSKGVSYVCAVKRKFRKPGQLLTNSLQQLIEFIDKNPNIAVANLKNKYLGLPSSKKEPKGKPAEDASEEAKPPEEEEAEKAQVRQLMLDLRWLVSEGYVTEYGNGRLFAPPPIEELPKKKKETQKPKDEQEVKRDEAAGDVEKEEPPKAEKAEKNIEEKEESEEKAEEKVEEKEKAES